MLEKDKNAEIADFFRREGLSPNVRLLLGMITPFSPLWKAVLGSAFFAPSDFEADSYQVAAKETAPSFHRDIVLALRDRKTAPLAVRRFLEYLPYR